MAGQAGTEDGGPSASGDTIDNEQRENEERTHGV